MTVAVFVFFADNK